MNAIIPLNWRASDQPEVCLVNQRGTSKRVILSSIGKTSSRDVTQFVVDNWNQLFARRNIASAPAKEQLGHLVGGGKQEPVFNPRGSIPCGKTTPLWRSSQAPQWFADA
jgi:hypothetical protein